MIEAVPSRTAARVAWRRAAHQVLDAPAVLDDPLALRIAGIPDPQVLRDDARERHPFSKALRAFLAARSRFAEDHVAESFTHGVRQCVVLGAGLDTLAYRHPHGDALKVFEVDFPATQAWKRQRLAEAGITIPPSVRYVPVDFERQTAFDALAGAGFDTAAPAVFSWLGVTMYLSEATVMSVLQSIARLARGSSVVFDYAIDPAMLSEPARRAVEAVASRAAKAGEPFTLSFDPSRLVARLRELGFTHIENLDGDAVNARYFQGRVDGLRVGSAGRLMHAAT